MVFRVVGGTLIFSHVHKSGIDFPTFFYIKALGRPFSYATHNSQTRYEQFQI